MHLILLSGGMDSTVALANTLANTFLVETISFNYGGKHNERENAAAKAIAACYDVRNTVIDLPFISELFKSNLLKSGGDIPDGHYADESMKKTVVPFRNGIFLSIAAGYAESNGCKKIVLANHSGDHHIYPDCRREFTDAMALTVGWGTDHRVEFVSPFVGIDKTEICKLGASLMVPFELTWSCYKGREIHCGTCGTCYERKEAFRMAGIKDPTKYEG